MTIGQLVECLVGKTAALQGMDADGTAFEEYDLESIKDKLEELGYERNGYEYLYNGMTGEKMQVMIFFGPTYYQRLKHLVEDKLHCLTMDHEVLTLDGWKTYDTLQMSDKIAILKDGKLKYEKPIDIYRYPNFKGKLYHIKSQQIDLTVTSNHKMYVSEDGNEFKLMEANDIYGKNVHYQKNAQWEDGLDIVHENIDINKLNGINFVDLSQNKCREILHDSEYYVSSEKTADNIMQLALHCGWSADKLSVNNEFKLVINKTNMTDFNDYHEEMYESEEPVFCVQVSSGIFYVRRNGKAVWTGNSRPRGPTTSLTHQAPEGNLHLHIMFNIM